jgi:hypothetical protein
MRTQPQGPLGFSGVASSKKIGKTRELIAKDEAQAAWAKIIGKTFACEAYDRGYYFRKISR